MLTLIGAVNSGIPAKGVKKGNEDEYIRNIREAYARFFQMARQKFHNIIYVKTPKPEFWKIQDAKTLSVFLPVAEYVDRMAMRYWALILDGAIHFSSLEKYRKQK